MRGLFVVGTFTAASAVVWSIPYGVGISIGVLANDLSLGQLNSSLFFGVAASAYFGLAWLPGYLSRRISESNLLYISAALFLVGLALFSNSSSFLPSLLWYTVGCGFAIAMFYTPILSVIARLSSSTPTARLAFVTIGVGLGTVLGPLMTQFLLGFGWRSAYRILGICGAVVAVTCGQIANRTHSRSVFGKSDGRIRFGDREFVYFFVSGCIAAGVFYLPVVFFPRELAVEGHDARAQSGLVALFGLASVVVRPVFGLFGRRIRGLVRGYAFTFAVLGVGCVAWALADDLPAYIFTALLFGVGYGGFVGLSGGMSLVVDVGGSDSLKLGVFMVSSGVGSLVGGPVTGLLIELGGKQFAFASLSLVCAVGLAFAVLLGRSIVARLHRTSSST